jgi:hypothetical protein
MQRRLHPPALRKSLQRSAPASGSVLPTQEDKSAQSLRPEQQSALQLALQRRNQPPLRHSSQEPALPRECICGEGHLAVTPPLQSSVRGRSPDRQGVDGSLQQPLGLRLLSRQSLGVCCCGSIKHPPKERPAVRCYAPHEPGLGHVPCTSPVLNARCKAPSRR